MVPSHHVPMAIVKTTMEIRQRKQGESKGQCVQFISSENGGLGKGPREAHLMSSSRSPSPQWHGPSSQELHSRALLRVEPGATEAPNKFAFKILLKNEKAQARPPSG